MKIHHLLTAITPLLLHLTSACLVLEGIFCSNDDSTFGGLLDITLTDNGVRRCHIDFAYYSPSGPEIYLDCDHGDTAWMRRQADLNWEMAWLPGGAAHDFRFQITVQDCQGCYVNDWNARCPHRWKLNAKQYGC